jgi:hypothetical protein
LKINAHIYYDIKANIFAYMEETLRHRVNALDVSKELDVIIFKTSCSKNLEILKIKATPSVERRKYLPFDTMPQPTIVQASLNKYVSFTNLNPTGTVHVTRHTVTEPIGSHCMWGGTLGVPGRH